VTVGASRDNANVVGVFNSGNDTGSENKFLPGLSNVQDVDTCPESQRKWKFVEILNAPSARLFQT